MAGINQGSYELKTASAFKIPYPDKTFDLVYSSYMLDLIAFDDISRILAEFKRVMKQNGRLVLVNMAEGRIFSPIYNFLYRLSPKMLGGCRPLSMTADVLGSSGFKVFEKEVCVQLFIPSEVIMAESS